MNLQAVQAVAFDLDGTLCDYGVSIQEAMAEAIRNAGHPIELVGDLDEAANRYNELWFEIEQANAPVFSLREKVWAHLLAEFGVEESGLARRMAEHYTRIRVPSIHLFEGVRELLIELERKYRLGLLTNGPSDMQWSKIEQLGIGALFETILVSGDVGFHKPDARIFKELLSRLGMSAKEALYVGNSYEKDVVGAKAAGMLSAWVRDGSQEPVRDAVPDVELANILLLKRVLP